MLMKVMALFLLAMAVLAMFGRLRLPKSLPRIKRLGAKRCKSCGRPQIGSGRCPCGQNPKNS